MTIKIEYIKISDIKTYAQNARTHSDEQVSQLVKSITEFGFTNPILIDENSELIAGHGRTMAAKDAGWKVRQCLIWNKSSLVMSRQDYHWKHEPCLYGWKDGAAHLWASDRKQTTVLNFDRPGRNGDHPTMKPVELFEYCLTNNTNSGGIVLDSFGGSGTTLIACEKNNRIGYLMELDPKYCDVIINRWESMTGKKAVLLNE